MMIIRKTFVPLLSTILALQACNKKEVVEETPQLTDSTLKKDSVVISPMAHIMDSATTSGQTFSTVKNANVSLKDDAITLKSLTELSTENSYLLFNDDQSKAEIFLPNAKNSMILARKGTEGNYTWADGTYELIQWKGYVLRTLKDPKPLFGGDAM